MPEREHAACVVLSDLRVCAPCQNASALRAVELRVWPDHITYSSDSRVCAPCQNASMPRVQVELCVWPDHLRFCSVGVGLRAPEVRRLDALLTRLEMARLAPGARGRSSSVLNFVRPLRLSQSRARLEVVGVGLRTSNAQRLLPSRWYIMVRVAPMVGRCVLRLEFVGVGPRVSNVQRLSLSRAYMVRAAPMVGSR